MGRAGAFGVDTASIEGGVALRTRESMTLQAQGDYVRAREMLRKLAVVRPEVKKVLDRLQGVPIDIEPNFDTAARRLAGRSK